MGELLAPGETKNTRASKKVDIVSSSKPLKEGGPAWRRTLCRYSPWTR